ncbi:19154_t:CDS:2, partial [Gigaspora rosea]
DFNYDKVKDRKKPIAMFKSLEEIGIISALPYVVMLQPGKDHEPVQIGP